MYAERPAHRCAGLPALKAAVGVHECGEARYVLRVMRRAVIAGLAFALLAPRIADACDEFVIETKVFERAARGGILVQYHASPTKGPAYEAPLVSHKWKFKHAN